MNMKLITRILESAMLLLFFMGGFAQANAQQMDTLSKKQQAIVPIAAMTAKGDTEQLKTVLAEGLDAGLTVNEIKEVMTHLYAYAGFPRSLNALTAFMGVLDNRKAKGIVDTEGMDAAPMPEDKTSLELGTEVQTRLSGAPVKGGVMDFVPAIDYFLKAHLFGDLFGRNNLDEACREIATLSALSALDGTEGQIKAHLRYASNAGVTGGQLWQIANILKRTPGSVSTHLKKFGY